MGRFVELNHVVSDGQVTYPGLPAPAISDHLSRADSPAVYGPGTEFHIGRIEMVANTGTYLDTPAHRYAAGPDLSGVPLESCADLAGYRASFASRAITDDSLAEAFGDADLAGAAVLLHTGWDRHFGTAAYGDSAAPFLAASGVEWLVARRPALVGIDSVNIDCFSEGPARPAHTGLLAAGILIVEHLTGLDALPANGFRFFATPVRVAGLGTFPVRAFAIVT
ncbi:cyclase [Virgisporangium aliadipatigenens]|uniref:Cyclase n=1 Tax=Virgisporangium aliadipatigenens TaxID=741659 RepID=A0A8J3YT58_9ACTN|nr:cyclase family protein [Virgisporangium aliadipatigenens]GIJ49968.1 cyclase [Virgisporangium aliadipatigenens]